MLDASFNTKLGGFGLARLVDHGRASYTTVLAGTMSYMDMDPECMVTGRASTESADIYSFGIVLLEIACGRVPLVVWRDDDVVIHLAQRVSELYHGGQVLGAADPQLNGNFNVEEMECAVVGGLWCVHPDRSMRPSIRQAVTVSMLWSEAEVPKLPVRMPPPAALVGSLLLLGQSN
jgi:serine/threonine protein kinase